MFVLSKLPGKGHDLSETIQDAILCQAEAWAGELARAPLPSFYSCNIRYRQEPIGAEVEEWVDPYTVKERGYGDCDDMVIWRLAEIFNKAKYVHRKDNKANMPAWPAVARIKGTGKYHVLIRHANGEFEDPANIMKDKLGEMPPKRLRRIF